MREIRKIEVTVPQMPKRKRVAAYARVSVDSEQLLHSLSAQVSYYSNLIQNNPNWEYAGVYADEGISGTGTAKRKEFLRMISDCEAGKIDLILVKSLSRMARNTVDLLNTVRHLKEIGVEVRFERENISTFTEDGEFLLTLLASYAQCESESISENVKWGKRKKFSQGHTKGIIPPCGYKCQDDEWIIVPEEAEIVKRIFNEYLGGKAKTALADEFKAEGIRNRSGGFRDHTAIDYILRNPAYVGDVLLQKTYVTDPFTKIMKWNKGELPQYLVKNHHEPIIDREAFAKTQAELKRRGELGIFAYGVVPTSCFTQKLECGKCHSVYQRDVGEIRVDGSQPIYWVCYGSYTKRKSKKAVCNAGRFLTEELLIEKCNEILGFKEFNEDIFSSKVAKIIIDSEKLTFHFNDGNTIEVKIQVKESNKVRKPPTKFSFWTGKIHCEVCGGNYIRQTRHYLNGDTEHYWICQKGNKCEGRKNGVLWQNDIDEGTLNSTDKVEFITAGLGRKLTIHFKDGTTKEIPWNNRKRHISQSKGE